MQMPERESAGNLMMANRHRFRVRESTLDSLTVQRSGLVSGECCRTARQLSALSLSLSCPRSERGIEIEIEQTMINLGYASEAKEERRSEAMHKCNLSSSIQSIESLFSAILRENRRELS